MWNRKVFVRIVELIVCIACVVALRVTDDESRRVFHYLRNRSREWSLLNNVTWGIIGAALATATCGGYVIISAGLLIAAATGELKGRKTELFFLGLGVILFAIVGALSLASIESVPQDLIDNAAVLGALCLFTALIFIADLLMSLPKEKKQDAVQTLIQKDSAKPHVITAMTTEKEGKSSEKQQASSAAKTVQTDDVDGAVNGGFEKPEEQQVKVNLPEKLEEHEKPEQDRSTIRPRSTDAYQEERNRSFDQVERELREYTQNFENGRALRDSQRFRDSEMLQRSARRDSMDAERRIQVYRTQDIYQRPIDEIDTPRFPTEIERRDDAIFAKTVNPGVKIMRIEHDVDDAFDAYRYSDMSQYDNVPTKMRGASLGILKKSRDVSFNVPPPPGSYETGYKMDNIEMLEKSFTALRTTSTGTQTGVRTPSSPNDPGYVRHTASNWPQDFKTKTPGSSPEHSRD